MEKEIKKLTEVLKDCIEQDFCDYVCYEASAENLVNAGYRNIENFIEENIKSLIFQDPFTGGYCIGKNDLEKKLSEITGINNIKIV